MKSNRRSFVKTLGVASLGAIVTKNSLGNIPQVIGNREMKLSFKPYDLQLKHTFTVAGFSRNTTPVVLTEIEYDGLVGYGEASMPPYLG